MWHTAFRSTVRNLGRHVDPSPLTIHSANTTASSVAQHQQSSSHVSHSYLNPHLNLNFNLSHSINTSTSAAASSSSSTSSSSSSSPASSSLNPLAINPGSTILKPDALRRLQKQIRTGQPSSSYSTSTSTSSSSSAHQRRRENREENQQKSNSNQSNSNASDRFSNQQQKDDSWGDRTGIATITATITTSVNSTNNKVSTAQDDEDEEEEAKRVAAASAAPAAAAAALSSSSSSSSSSAPSSHLASHSHRSHPYHKVKRHLTSPSSSSISSSSSSSSSASSSSSTSASSSTGSAAAASGGRLYNTRHSEKKVKEAMISELAQQLLPQFLRREMKKCAAQEKAARKAAKRIEREAEKQARIAEKVAAYQPRTDYQVLNDAFHQPEQLQQDKTAAANYIANLFVRYAYEHPTYEQDEGIDEDEENEERTIASSSLSLFPSGLPSHSNVPLGHQLRMASNSSSTSSSPSSPSPTPHSNSNSSLDENENDDSQSIVSHSSSSSSATHRSQMTDDSSSSSSSHSSPSSPSLSASPDSHSTLPPNENETEWNDVVEEEKSYENTYQAFYSQMQYQTQITAPDFFSSSLSFPAPSPVFSASSCLPAAGSISANACSMPRLNVELSRVESVDSSLTSGLNQLSMNHTAPNFRSVQIPTTANVSEFSTFLSPSLPSSVPVSGFSSTSNSIPLQSIDENVSIAATNNYSNQYIREEEDILPAGVSSTHRSSVSAAVSSQTEVSKFGFAPPSPTPFSDPFSLPIFHRNLSITNLSGIESSPLTEHRSESGCLGALHF